MEQKNAQVKFDEVFENYIRAANPLENPEKEEAARIEAIIKIAELAEANILKRKDQIFAKGENDIAIKFEFSPLPKGSKSAFETEYKKAVLNMGNSNELNIGFKFNVDKLKGQSPLVVYHAFYTNMYSALLEKRAEYNKNPGGLENEAQVEDEQQQEGAETSLEDAVLDFLIEKIRKLFGIANKGAAKLFMQDYQENSGQSLTESWFDFNGTRDATLAHANMMGNKAQEAFKNGDTSLVYGYAQQGMMLAGSISDVQFKALTSNGSADRSKLQGFCYNYASAYLAQNGIENANSVSITFDNNPKLALGTYFSSQNRVNINLDKIGELGNPTEVVMTISHELTHAIDAELGTVRGPDGKLHRMLANNMSEDLRAAQNDAPDVRQLVTDIQQVCYYVNPNERHARVAELTALEFMLAKAGNNPALKRSIKESTNGFIVYQRDTIRNIQGVVKGNKVQELRNRFNALQGKASPAAKSLITQRFEYFELLEQKGFMTTQIEEAAIQQAQQILNQLNGNQQTRQTQSERTVSNQNELE